MSLFDFSNQYKSTYIYKREFYNNNCERIIKLNCSVFGNNGKKASIKRDKNDRIDEEKLASSISRSKRNIRRICLSNDFTYFATWTVNSQFADRFSVQSVQDSMRKLLKQFKKNCPDFKYIYVIEKHKDGALHFHGLVKGLYLYHDLYKDYENISSYCLREFDLNDFDKLPRYILDTLQKGVKIYYVPFFNDNLGYCTFSKINNYDACCNYIIKYISKNPVRNENDQVYFCSKGLRKCISEEYLKFVDDKFFDSSYKTTYKYVDKFTGEIKESLLCEVKDIYINNFNNNTKIDYILDSIDKENIL